MGHQASLNGGLLIHVGRRHVPGRIHVQPDNIGGLKFEIGIVAGHVALGPMRLRGGRFPGAMDGVFVDTKSRSQFARTPVRRSDPRDSLIPPPLRLGNTLSRSYSANAKRTNWNM